MSIDIRHLKHFDAVYRLRSFVRAAEDQTATQSALTKSIKSLEIKLGEKLFDRTTHSVKPTAVGEQLILQARDVINSLHVFEEQSRHLTGLHTGSINIGSGPYPLQQLLTSAIQAFSDKHGAIQVNVHTGGPGVLLSKLIDRQLDMVISDISKFETMSFFDDIEIAVLPVEPLVIVHHRDHEIAGQPPETQRLVKYPWALPRHSPHFTRLVAGHGKEAGSNRPFPQYVIEVPSACIELTRRGHILTAVPKSYAEMVCANQIPGQELVIQALPDAFQTNDGIHTLKNKRLSPAAREFFNVVKKEAAKRPKQNK